jgi:hypothetical protein
MMKNRPFGFVDHALKCGDSLVGVSSVGQIESFSLKPDGRQITFATAQLSQIAAEVSAKRLALENLPSNDHSQIETKKRLHGEAEAATATAKALADCLIAFEMEGLDGDAYEEQRVLAAHRAEAARHKPLAQFQTFAREQLPGYRTFHWPLEFPEVFAHGGFDAFVGNPPFLGGKRISTELGVKYGPAIKRIVTPNETGAADLAAYFFRRCATLVRGTGYFGLIATNSLSQGDTRIAALKRLNDLGFRIYRAFTDYPWPGTAGVVVHIVFLTHDNVPPRVALNGIEVDSIDSYLEEGSALRAAEPFQLGYSPCEVSTGTYLYGEGFVLSEAEMRQMTSLLPESLKVIQPYITSDDLNSRPDLSAGRYAINFEDKSEVEARKYGAPFHRLEELVKPVRSELTGQIHEHCFWKHWDRRPELYSAISTLPRAIICGRLSKYFLFAFVSPKYVFSDQLVVFGSDKAGLLCVLQSELHVSWAIWRMTTMGKTPRYSVSRCFRTFPMPENFQSAALADIGESYSEYRNIVLSSRSVGLTQLYNLLHDQGEQSVDIVRLRALHQEMDHAVAAAYGWGELDLGHGFRETKQGIRYTISESARRTVLDRLLVLNHQRHVAEGLAGLHKKKRGKPSGTRTPANLNVTEKRKDPELFEGEA